jgi:hypothetical protein
MAKQKFRHTRLGVFSGAKAYIEYVEILKKRRIAVGRTFCDAIKVGIPATVHETQKPVSRRARRVRGELQQPKRSRCSLRPLWALAKEVSGRETEFPG